MISALFSFQAGATGIGMHISDTRRADRSEILDRPRRRKPRTAGKLTIAKRYGVCDTITRIFDPLILEKGDRVVVPFTIACGGCFFCKKTLFSCCDTSNPNAKIAETAMGHSPSGLFGFSHMLGGFAGGQAEYLRVPFADVGPLKIESDLADENVLFLSDIFPTGYMAAENCDIEPGDTVAVWGCGPVGQFAIQSAWMFKAGRVIAIDRVPERLQMARVFGKAETINFDDDKVYDKLMDL